MKTLIFTISVITTFAFLSARGYGQCTNCESTTNNGTNSSAIGTESISSGHSSFASGFGSEAQENYTTALGFFTKAQASKAIALGSAVKANSYKSVVIGSGIWNAKVFLTNDIPYSMMIGFESRYPTLFISKSAKSPTFSGTGRIGIGNVTDPQAKLHLRADDGESAAMLIEPNEWAVGGFATLYLGSMANGFQSEYGKGLLFNSEFNYIFKNGNIGMGTDEPAAKLQVADGDIYISDIEKGIIMKSVDGQCWRGTVDVSGTLQFVAIECPDEGSVGIEDDIVIRKNHNVKIYPNPANQNLTIEVETADYPALLVELNSINGGKLIKQQLKGKITEVDLSSIASGAYVVVVKTISGEILKREKVVVQ